MISATVAADHFRRGISSVGRAFEWHSKGRRFDPDILHFTTPCKTRGCVVLSTSKALCAAEKSVDEASCSIIRHLIAGCPASAGKGSRNNSDGIWPPSGCGVIVDIGLFDFHGWRFHAILHKIEGDLDNSRYWYRPAGKMECAEQEALAELATVKAMIQNSEQVLIRAGRAE